MIVDLHAHYPIHLVPDEDTDVLELLCSRRGLTDTIRALIVGLASQIDNYSSFDAGPGVTIKTLREGGVNVVLSVLYSPFSELDFDADLGSPPRAEYLATLLRQLELVETDLRTKHGSTARVVRSVAELDQALTDGLIAFVHCVEGGFHVGATPEGVERGVAELAARGVAYITIAHLLYRGVATNAPALPFLSDRAYHLLFHQPKEGLSELGRALVTAMVRHGVMIDITHMSDASIADTFTLLDELDPDHRVPVIASHTACQFGKLEYNVADKWIAKIGERGGACGVIACEHYARDGLRKQTKKTFAGSVDAIVAQVQRVERASGGTATAAIGTDLDGFIKPTLAGLGDSSRLAALRTALIERLGAEQADAICSANALRVLRAGWGAGTG